MNDTSDTPETRYVRYTMDNRPPGRVNPSRMGKRNPLDTEERPPIPPEDIEATRAELAELRRRRTPKSA